MNLQPVPTPPSEIEVRLDLLLVGGGEQKAALFFYDYHRE
jgi:hypothetical protein